VDVDHVGWLGLWVAGYGDIFCLDEDEN